MEEYEARVTRELESYREERPELGLPPIFTYWAVRYVVPRLVEVMGAQSIPEFFAKHIAICLLRSPSRHVASLGSGDCSAEIEIARNLLSSGARDFCFSCYDISPFVIERAKAAIAGEGLERHFEFVVQDLNAWSPSIEFAAVMANHALHHMLKLEHIFDTVKAHLARGGAFIAADMIGRNGHMRWPEALTLINAMWEFCPNNYKYNHLLNRFEEQYDNWDCSKDGFEGIRAQDILPALAERFHFERFMAFGNLPDIFVERTFGPNLATDNPKDVAFIDFLELLNSQLISAGTLKPTQMVAVMSEQSTLPTICDRNWSPRFCIRPTDDAGIPAPAQIQAPVRRGLSRWNMLRARLDAHVRQLFT